MKEAIKKRSPLWYELPILFLIIGGIISYFAIRKNDPVKAKRCIYIGIIFSIPLLLVLGYLLLVGSGTSYVVSSASMAPELQIYDIVVADKSFPFESIEVGDIIVFNRPSGSERTIVHRVVSIIEDDPLTVRTKGDANPASIPGTDFPITKSEYIGKVSNVIQEAGYISRILTPPLNYFFTVIQFVVFFIPIILHFKFRKEQKNMLIPKNDDKDDLKP